MLTMANWQRNSGTFWTRQTRGWVAQVRLGTGGWHWQIINATGAVVRCGSRPTRRSRKARRQAQKALLRLAA